ncbi:MAG: methyltransferase domain-containing protein [Phycisphaerales bacterium]|nr:methyltransferase domain-containing protein [Phycisphaerales bacterium]
MAESAPPDEISLFRQSWTLYDAITHENYMFHRELYACVADMLRQRRAQGDYSILDLGCGSARFLSPCLRAAPPESYVGVDLSAVALDEARGYLEGVPSVALHGADMLEFVAEMTGEVDVIFSGYAVHHLDLAGKEALFQASRARLRPGGEFIMIDVMRGEGESREQYLEDYLGQMRRSWTAVIPEQLEEACRHVAEFDFPESLSTLTCMATDAGFGGTRLVERHAQHQLAVFTA